MTKETVVCYIGTMFTQVEQGTKHPEAFPWHKFTQMFTVVIGYLRNYQIRVIKLIRGSNILKDKICEINREHADRIYYFRTSLSSPERKVQVSFSDHLSFVVCLSVRPSVCL